MKHRTTSEWLDILSKPSDIPHELLSECRDDINALVKGAAEDTMFDFADGYKVWQIYYEQAVKNQNVNLSQASSIWMWRLAIPSIAIKDLYQQCVECLSAYSSDNNYMAAMSKVASMHSKTSRISDSMMMYEIHLARNKNDESYWIKYMLYCMENVDSTSYGFADNIFERMCRLCDLGLLNMSFESWNRYFIKRNASPETIRSLTTRFPNSSRALQLVVKKYSSEIQKLYEFRTELECMHPSDEGTQRVLEGILWRVNRVPSSITQTPEISYVVKLVFTWASDLSLTDVQRTCICTFLRFKLSHQLLDTIHSFLHLDSDPASLIVDDWLFSLDICVASLDFIDAEARDSITKLFEKCHASFYGRPEYARLRSKWMIFKTMYIDEDKKYPMDDIPGVKKRAFSDSNKVSAVNSAKRMNSAPHASGLTRALEEKREVYITQLDFNVDSDALQRLLSKVGDIEAAKIPLKRNRAIQGRNNDGFAYVTYVLPESAEKAVQELDNYELFGRKIHVVLADAGKVHTRTHGRKPKQIRFNQSRTVVLLNVQSAAMSDIKHKIEEIGKVTKYEERPDLHTVVAEFATEKDCGLAGLKLDGFQMAEGGTIRLGNLAALRKTTRK